MIYERMDTTQLKKVTKIQIVVDYFTIEYVLMHY